ncbi:hypothetical protein QUW15_11975, partial [Desulfovibrio piger]|nr:hypothetical protein [Desulfovibrio piger]
YVVCIFYLFEKIEKTVSAAPRALFAIEKGKTRGGGQCRPARSERKNTFFPQNDRPCGLKYEAFQTESV